MNCEEFLFEVSYLMDAGDGGELGLDALAHADHCLPCHARFYQLKRQQESAEMEFTPWMRQRLHQNLDLVISQRQASPKMWLQMAFTCLLLVGSLVGIAYQNHPTATPPVLVGR